ncbi:MAG: c-type cytochrome [Gemmatimonadetes bacterium]|nr:c-type cytochrome [Gemmatimonadota bacterium]MBT8405129.1 c-type cytochrome [Gemmatimonadota bacterium]NNK49718.1 c-type cytochrome [Gemmatimonadota bacterium]
MRKAFRFAALALVLSSTAACNTLDDAMVAVFGRSMRDSPSFDPYENPRLPAEGAVSFSSGNFTTAPGAVNLGNATPVDYDVPDFTQANTANPADVLLASLENPVAADAESLARGEELYIRNCAVCHGEAGLGAEAYILEKWPALAAYNLALDPVAGYPDGYLYGMIRVGRGMMPQYGHQITHFDRWNIVNYVRTLQGSAAGAGED